MSVTNETVIAQQPVEVYLEIHRCDGPMCTVVARTRERMRSTKEVVAFPYDTQQGWWIVWPGNAHESYEFCSLACLKKAEFE